MNDITSKVTLIKVKMLYCTANAFIIMYHIFISGTENAA